MHTVHIAVVSLGSIGRRHLENLQHVEPDAEVTLCHLQRGPGSSVPEHDEVDQVVYGLDGLVDIGPDAVVIACPASEHIRVARRLAKEGIPLLIEKPLSDDMSGVEDVLRIAEDHDATLAVGYNLRFHEPLQVLREALRQDRIGDVRYVRAEVGQYLPDWRDKPHGETVSAKRKLGGGALLELSHEIDLVRWIAGEVREVTAVTARLSDLDIDVEDTAEIIIGLESGAIGSVHLDMIQRSPRRSLRIEGSQGRLHWTAEEDRVRLYDAGSRDWEWLGPESPPAWNDMYIDEISDFLESVRRGTDPSVHGREGKRTLAVVEAARRAARKGQRVEI